MRFPDWRRSLLYYASIAHAEIGQTGWSYIHENRRVYIIADLNLTNLAIVLRSMMKNPREKQVEVVALKRDPVSGEVTHLEVSIKGAEEIPYTELRTGNTYTGKICSFSDTAYYVRVAGVPMDVRCPISSNNIMDTLDVGDFVKFVVRGVYDATPTGSIRKIIKKAVPTTW